jgi:hypothetical protein
MSEGDIHSRMVSNRNTVIVTHRLVIVFHGNASFSQTFGNTNGDDRRRGISDVSGTVRIQGRIIARNGLERRVRNRPQSSGTRLLRAV